MALLEKPQLPPLKVGSSDYRGTRYHYVQTYMNITNYWSTV